ncbi:L domain-like protein [Rhizoclosmatium globosum]|uniref:L domain-like protein n=1 Tax=Rhizoclosmatium globosum TaxID=329046 RepID=A0A1Y2BVT8_9FUNG|nr:L domain-like protein [Rhizoclosmatium globosum]|eukprot:ORY38880.1 L domain-like protein [Rhizoclosmatium globosum]
MTDCDLLHGLYHWIPSGDECCRTSNAVDCSNGNVSELRLIGPDYSRPFPMEITQLTWLKGLTLIATNITGSIPSEISQLQQLTLLQISLPPGSISGPIPTELGLLLNLKRLVITGLGAPNARLSINGTIPSQLAQLKNLEYLAISSTSVTGAIPTELGRLSQLSLLSLEWNYLSGTLPSEIGNLRKLAGLEINHNQLRGSLPTSLGNLTLIQNIDVGNNFFSGAIPTELGKLSQLLTIRFSDNNLSGYVPAELYSINGILSIMWENNPLLSSNSFLIFDAAEIEAHEKLTKALVGITALFLIIVATYVPLESYKKGVGINSKKMTNAFNLTLFLMGLTLFIMALVHKFTEYGITEDDFGYGTLLLVICNATFQLSYIKYSYARSQNIIETVASQVSWIARGFDMLAPIIYVQVIPAALLLAPSMRYDSLYALNFILPTVAMGCTALFDFLLIGAFSVFIHKKTRIGSDETLDPRFLIVSRYGIAANMMYLVAIIIEWVVVGGDKSVGTLAIPLFWFRHKAIMQTIFMLGASIILLIMKIALYLNQKREDKRARTNLKRAKQIVEGKTSEATSSARESSVIHVLNLGSSRKIGATSKLGTEPSLATSGTLL